MTRILPGSLLLLAACASSAPEGDARSLYQEAIHLLARNAPPEEVMPLLDAAIRKEPDRPRFYLARGAVRRAQGRQEDALADYGAALALPQSLPQRASTLLQRGILYGESGRMDEAEADFAAALEAVPEYVEVYLQRAHYRKAAGRTADAERDEAEARKRGARLAETFYNEGVRQLNLRDLESAERHFRFALQLDPSSLPALVALSRVALQGGRFDEAERILTRAIALNPEDPSLYYYRGNASRARSRFPEALGDYTRAVERDPDRTEAYVARGMTHLLAFKDYTRAEQDFARALARDPRNYDAFLGFGLLYRELTLFNHAEQSLRTALRLRATPEAAQELGRVLHAKGKFGEADRVFREALRICKDDVRRESIERDLAQNEADRAEEKQK